MTATETNPAETGNRPGEGARIDQQPLFTDGEPISVRVDSDWRILGGARHLGHLLGMTEAVILGLTIGQLLHPDDVEISPTAISALSRAVVLRFQHRTDGYLRLAVLITSVDNGWLLRLRDVDAEVLDLRRGSR